MVAWESDAVIVPMIPGNAGEGKDWHTSRTCPRETSAIRRDRRRDGNETGQDKGNVRSDRARLTTLAGGTPAQKGAATPLVASHGTFTVMGAFKR